MKFKGGWLFLVLLLLAVTSKAQKRSYFKNRLLIKYTSPAALAKLKSRQQGDPVSAVRQYLWTHGATDIQPLFSASLQRAFRRKAVGSKEPAVLPSIREVKLNETVDPAVLAAKLNRMDGVAYAEPRYIRTMSFTPDDPILGSYVTYHHFPAAWDITKGSRNQIIAIVDGGVGYLHPDLDDKLWINQNEIPAAIFAQVDQNPDGTVTSTEVTQFLQNRGVDDNGDGKINLKDALDPDSPFMNQLDDDNNGFRDDLFGWDFWATGNINQTITTDNNPIYDGTDHGTHVAGIAAAETNNSTDIAGAGFKSIYMPIKAGGTQDDPSTPGVDEAASIGFGYEAIMYAALMGADVINCSWGGPGYSQAENDVIKSATQMGSVVVAAAGNEHAPYVVYPAAFPDVIGVGSVATNDQIASYSNYGYGLDVLATGSSIKSTSYGSSLVVKSGTSMASPVVSGLAALVKNIHPAWPAQRIHSQIRTSSVSIDNANTGRFKNKLGHGRVDAYNALTTNHPGLEVLSYDFQNDEGGKLRFDEEGTLNIQLVNYGNTASNITLALKSQSGNKIQFDNSSQTLSPVGTGANVNVTFGVKIESGFDLSKTPTLKLTFNNTAQNYFDFTIITYYNFSFDVMSANNIKTSFASNGTVGFADAFNGTGGVGFIPRSDGKNGNFQQKNNTLFEGGLMIMFNQKLYDAVRSSDSKLSRDFMPQKPFRVSKPGTVSDEDGTGRFSIDSGMAQKAAIKLQTYAYNKPSISNVVFLKYTVSNTSSQPLNNLYMGLFNDWDLGTNTSKNSISYLAADSLLYAADQTTGNTTPLVSVVPLANLSGALAIDNAADGQQDSLSFGIYDGFTDAEKKRALVSGKANTAVQNTDISAVVASGPYHISAGGQITVGFLYAFGDDLNQLRSQVSNARKERPFETTPVGQSGNDEPPGGIELSQNYPNPFSPSSGGTTFCISLQKATHVTFTIYDVLGRKVRKLIDDQEIPPQPCYKIPFSGQGLSSGLYFARMTSGLGTQTISFTLVK